MKKREIIVLIILSIVIAGLILLIEKVSDKEIEISDSKSYCENVDMKETSEKVSFIPEELKVGDVVYYTSNGKYIWQARYYSSNAQLLDIKLDSSSKGAYYIRKWNVFDIDKENGIVKLISLQPTSSVVPLCGAQGYNNGVKLLNEACNSLYGNAQKGITARNLNIEDIEEKMSEQALSEVYVYKKDSVPYGEKIKNEYGEGASFNPIIYEQNDLKKSEQLEFIEKEVNNKAIFERFNNPKTIQPYQTFWYGNTTFMKKAFQNDIYYDLIISDTMNCNFWISTRNERTLKSYCSFGLYAIVLNKIDSLEVMDSNLNSSYASAVLSPIVSVPVSKLLKIQEGSWLVQ